MKPAGTFQAAACGLELIRVAVDPSTWIHAPVDQDAVIAFVDSLLAVTMLATQTTLRGIPPFLRLVLRRYRETIVGTAGRIALGRYRWTVARQAPSILPMSEAQRSALAGLHVVCDSQ